MSSSIPEPKVRYAWSLVKSGHILSDPSTAIYLSNNENILFPGLEYVIGLNRFMDRAIDLSHRELFDYAIGLGLSFNVHGQLVSKVVDRSTQDFAKDLCQRFNLWNVYLAKYEPKSKPGNTYPLAKYGHFDLALKTVNSNYTPYFSGLLEGGHVERAIQLLKKCPEVSGYGDAYNDGRVGRLGSLKLVEAYLDATRNEKIKNGVLMNIISYAIEANRVDFVGQLLKRHKGSVYLKVLQVPSIAMYDLIKDHCLDAFIYENRKTCLKCPECHIDPIIHGGNFTLFLRILPKLEPMSMNNLYLGIPDLFKDIIVEKIKKIKVKNHCHPFIYNYLRGIGMPKQEGIKFDIWHFNPDLLPYLKLDME